MAALLLKEKLQLGGGRWRLLGRGETLGGGEVLEGTRAAFMKHLVARMKEPRDVAGLDEGAGRTDGSLQNSDSSPAERTGRMMGEREEEEQRRLREIKGAFIKGLSLLSFDRGKEVGKRGASMKSQ